MMLMTNTLQQIHQHGQHHSLENTEADHPGKNYSQRQQIPYIEHLAQRVSIAGGNA